MDEQERSPRELHQNSQDSEKQTSQNGFIKDSNSKLYLPRNYLSGREKKPSWLLKPRKGGKTLWDWLDLLFVPVLIATIAGVFTLFTVSQQNEVFRQQNEIYKQRDEAEKERNRQTLLLKYLGEIPELVEKRLLTLNDDENSKIQRTIARARTLSVLIALDSDRKGELIEFLSAAKLIEQDKPIISLERANLVNVNLERAYLVNVNLERANLEDANLERAYLVNVNLKDANLEGANLEGANLEDANLEGANLEGANLEGANLADAYLWSVNLEGANLEDAYLGDLGVLSLIEFKTACNWEKARISLSEEFKQELDYVSDQKVDCSRWN